MGLLSTDSNKQIYLSCNHNHCNYYSPPFLLPNLFFFFLSKEYLFYTVSSKTVSIGFSMKLACEKTLTQDEPISHIIVETGDARNASGNATISKPVYNCEVVKVKVPILKSWPPNLEITANPPPTKPMTNISKTLVINA